MKLLDSSEFQWLIAVPCWPLDIQSKALWHRRLQLACPPETPTKICGKKLKTAMETAAGNVEQEGPLGVVGEGGLLQLPNELLMRPVTMQAVDPDLLKLIQRFKRTHTRIWHAFRVEMYGSPLYCHALETIFCMPGTNIPRWAETVTALPLPADRDALMVIFNENAAMFQFDDHALQVGGAYGYLEPKLGPEFDDVFTASNSRYLYMEVKIEIGPLGFFVPTTVPVLEGNLADLSKVPNIFRRVMNFLGVTHNYPDILHNAPDVTEYMRLVRVMAHHTMQDVQIALASVEGWNQVDECVMYTEGGDEYESDANVFFEHAAVIQTGVLIFPSVWFSCE